MQGSPAAEGGGGGGTRASPSSSASTTPSAVGGVQVVIRVRPKNKTESGPEAPTSGEAIKLANDGMEVQYVGDSSNPQKMMAANSAAFGGGSKRFTYDAVFPTSITQSNVFERVGLPLVDNVLKGFNSTLLAYGQTSSGKTHSMLGPEGGNPALITSSERGLIPRVVERLFDVLSQRQPAELSWTVNCSVFELYNEDLFDLVAGRTAALALGGGENGLSPSPSSSSPAAVGSPASFLSKGSNSSSKVELRIREDRASGRGVFVEGLSSVDVKNATDTLSVIRRAAEAKHMGSTLANETSSRSHTLVQLHVTQIDHVQSDAKTSAQLYMVDLAGSERISKTGAAGDRLKEAQNINLSLTLLGNVINKLTDGKSLHVPYRDSKLTRLLQDSLGGNALTTLLCAVSPSAMQTSETLSTLQFASRAKNIKNKPVANKELSEGELRKAYAAALEEIQSLKEKLIVFQGGDPSAVVAIPSSLAPSAITTTTPAAALSSATASEKSTKDDEVSELKATIQSLLRELQIEREEKRIVQKELQELKDRLQFYEKRDSGLEGERDEWKQKAEREQKTAETWMKKFQEMFSSQGNKGGGGSPATPSAATPGGKKATPQPPLGVRGQKTQPQRSGSVAKKSATASVEQQQQPKTPPAEASLPLDSKKDTGTSSTSAFDAAAAEERELKALVRERMLLGQVEEQRAKLHEANRFAVALDRLKRDHDRLIEDHATELEKQTAKYEELLKRQDDEIASLQLKLDTKAVDKEKWNEQRVKLTEELDAMKAEVDKYRQQDRYPAAAGRGPRGALYDDAHLKQENAALHAENRQNAIRLLEFTKKIDSQSQEINKQKEDKEKLLNEIEEANISAELKAKLLGGRLTQMKSNFRARLLDCFSRDEDD